MPTENNQNNNTFDPELSKTNNTKNNHFYSADLPYPENQENLDLEQFQVDKLTEKAILVGCLLPNSKHDPDDPLGELKALADTAGAEVVGTLIQNRKHPDFTTYLGKGKIAELTAMKDELGATLVVFDNDLSPSQIRNIEKVIECKIIDRSELILDIFAGRATTFAAKLQVELAQLEYTYPRLRAMWSHLGQITGGAPVGIGTRGPGETQIETDRRLILQRKSVLKKRIEEINKRREREVQKRNTEHLTICLVGYTNAGKSTLFNTLTEPSGGGGAYADDRLFATLTSRTRKWVLGSSESVMLSDTVGFVRDLPHHLIASFKATLEEAIHADLLLIVLDVADPQAALHYEVVNETLDNLENNFENSANHNHQTIKSPDKKNRHNNNAENYSNLHSDKSQADTIKQSLESDNYNLTATNHKYSGDRSNNTGSSHHPRRLLVLNKSDRLEDKTELAIWHHKNPQAIPISAVTGAGLNQLTEVIKNFKHGTKCDLLLRIPIRDGKTLTFVEHRTEVLDRQYENDWVILHVKTGNNYLPQLKAMGVSIDYL